MVKSTVELILDRYYPRCMFCGSIADGATATCCDSARRVSKPYAPGEKMTDRHPDSVIAQVVEEFGLDMQRRAGVR